MDNTNFVQINGIWKIYDLRKYTMMTLCDEALLSGCVDKGMLVAMFPESTYSGRMHANEPYRHISYVCFDIAIWMKSSLTGSFVDFELIHIQFIL